MRSRYFSLLAFCLLVGSVVSSTVQTSPVFMWANNEHFSGKNSQYVPLTPIESIFESFSSQGPLASFVSVDRKLVETVVLFIEPSLRSEELPKLAGAYSANPNGGVFANLKNFVENSESSLVAPYVTSESGAVGSKLASQLSQFAQISGRVFLVSSQEFSIETSKNVVALSQHEFLSKKIELNNGKTDLVVVRLDGDLKADDETVRQVMEIVGSSSFVAIYTAEKVSGITFEKRSLDSASSEFESRFAQSAEEIEHLETPIWNDDIVMGLILSIPLLLILGVGTRCLFELQSEMKFPSQNKQKKNN